MFNVQRRAAPPAIELNGAEQTAEFLTRRPHAQPRAPLPS
jgi:hypothetical protein